MQRNSWASAIGWCPYLLALSREDGLHELRVRMQPGSEITGHGIGVKGHDPVPGRKAALPRRGLRGQHPQRAGPGRAPRTRRRAPVRAATPSAPQTTRWLSRDSLTTPRC